MRALRPVLAALSVVVILMGLLWIGQGLGYIHWPASSFMIDERPWALRGALLAVVGVGIGLFSRRLGR